MILITGATGTVGGHLVHALDQKHAATRSLVRSAEKGDSLRGFDTHIALGSYDDPHSLDHALQDVDQVFLLAPPSERLAEQEIAVVSAVRRTGRDVHVVKLAAAGFDQGHTALGEQHAAVVEHLRNSGLPTTVLAPNSFMQNTLAWAAGISETGRFSTPAGEAAISHVDARDVAAVAAHVLTTEGHVDATYTVTGPEALTYYQVAEQLSDVLGTTVSYQDVPPAAAREGMVSAGLSPWLADALVELNAVHASGGSSGVTDEVQKATGRPAHSFADFLSQHQGAFRSL